MESREIKEKIEELQYELYKKEQEYFFNKLLISGWFFGEYTKFKEKTGLMIQTEYLGGDTCDYKNYKLSIIKQKYFKRKWGFEEISSFLFDRVIKDLYEEKEHTNDFASFISDLISNKHRKKN